MNKPHSIFVKLHINLLPSQRPYVPCPYIDPLQTPRIDKKRNYNHWD
jgi:hypothetical protein